MRGWTLLIYGYEVKTSISNLALPLLNPVGTYDIDCNLRERGGDLAQSYDIKTLCQPLVCGLYHMGRPGERFVQKHILQKILVIHQIWTKAQTVTWGTFQLFREAFDICNPVSIALKIFEEFRMEIQNPCTTPSESNQLLHTVWLESRNITTQPGEIDDRKFEIIAFVVYA